MPLRAIVLVSLATALVPVGAPCAWAATAAAGSYIAAPGETNVLTVTLLGLDGGTGEYGATLKDAGAPITPGDSCVAVSANEVTCTHLGTIKLGDGDDSLTMTATRLGKGPVDPLVVHGGAGDDTLVGSALPERLYGDAGADRLEGRGGEQYLPFGPPTEELHGGPGRDVLLGGSGVDLLEGGIGADILRGGSGADVASYLRSVSRVWASLDGRANDGARGERDLVARDVEGLIGSRNADVLIGGPRSDRISGAGGPDTIRGRGGDDDLEGNEGADDIAGGDGRDFLNAGHWDERGHLRPEFRARPDLLRGGPGNDALFAGDCGRDRLLDGGPGRDSAEIDHGLDPLRDVENVRDFTNDEVCR